MSDVVKEHDENGQNAVKVTPPERDAFGRVLPGSRLPGAGRHKGSGGPNIKQLVRDWLETNPGDLTAFVEYFVKVNRELTWQMLEGKPHQSGDMDVRLPQNLIDIFNEAAKSGTGKESPAEDQG